MSTEADRQFQQRLDHIIEALKLALIFAEEVRSGEEEPLQGGLPDGDGPECGAANARPWADLATLSVIWAGKSCYLGYTKLFRLADRLFRSALRAAGLNPDELRVRRECPPDQPARGELHAVSSGREVETCVNPHFPDDTWNGVY